MNPLHEVVDMSAEAVFRRLEQLGHLYELGMSLRQARSLGRVEAIEEAGLASTMSPEGVVTHVEQNLGKS